MEVKIPSKLSFLLTKKARHKVAYGGRGAGKSIAFADGLLSLAKLADIDYPDRAFPMHWPKRILCARELQNSIRDSVHRLLQDRIEFHNLGGEFEITDSELRCIPSGTNFIFKGLRSNISEIKSLQGIDICWVEEAQKVSDASIEILTPTIRGDVSTRYAELWWSLNTGAETDPVYDMFINKPRPDTVVEKVNYYDNPWFPDVLKQEMEYDRKYNPDRYRHVWLGEPGVEGMFFHEFGPHLLEEPFDIEQSECEGQLFLSLDHGTTHPTVAMLWWVAPMMDKWRKQFGKHYSKHLLMTYSGQGLSAGENANELYQKIEVFPHTHGVFPRVCWYDPSMDTKIKKDQYTMWAPIDEYKERFSRRNVLWQPANNNREHGCSVMRSDYRIRDGVPGMYYWAKYNGSYPPGIKRVIADENNLETYAKMEGDDWADCSRYGQTGLMAWITGEMSRSHIGQAIKQVNARIQATNWKDL